MISGEKDIAKSMYITSKMTSPGIKNTCEEKKYIHRESCLEEPLDKYESKRVMMDNMEAIDKHIFVSYLSQCYILLLLVRVSMCVGVFRT